MHACSAGCGGKEREGEGEGAKRDSGQISPWQGSLPVLGIFPHRRHSCLAFAAAKRKQDSHARRESHRNSIHRSAAIRFVRTSRSLNPLMQLFSPSLGWTFDLGLLLLHCCLCPRFSSSFAARLCVSFYRRTSPQPSALSPQYSTVQYSTVQYRAQFSSPFAVRRRPPSAVIRNTVAMIWTNVTGRVAPLASVGQECGEDHCRQLSVLGACICICIRIHIRIRSSLLPRFLLRG